MNKKIALFFLLFVTFNSFSQIETGNEIVAEGYASSKVKPDIASITITIEKENSIEKDALKELNFEIDKLQKTLTKLGFNNNQIKISDYSISSSKEDNEKRYSATNKLVIELALNNKVIDAFYQEIQLNNHKDLDVEFETKLSAELEKSTTTKLVQLAIQDAKLNADNIAKTLNIKLGNIKRVSKYNDRILGYDLKVDQVKFVKAGIAKNDMPSSVFNNYDVEEKEYEERITIVYEIKY